MSLDIKGSAPVFKSTMRFSGRNVGERSAKGSGEEQLSWAEQSEIEQNNKKLQEEQAKAAEDLKRKQQQER